MDEEIAQKLGSRMEIAARIGDHKRAHQVAILQPERWERIMARQLELAPHLGLSDAFVREYMDAVHRESIRQQTTVDRSWPGARSPVFRCGRMVDRPEEAESGPSLVVAGTQLGTVAKSQLLEEQWRLVDLIGRGQTGEVWHAHDVQLDRPVAVKLMHPELASDPAQVMRFEREARLLAGVEHPNLLPVLGSGRVGGRPFLVTRLLEGKTLAEVMHQRGGRVPASEAARILIPICDALTALHEANVVHRDLKPSNVFAANDQSVTLMDLGSAREANSELTRFGEVLGTEGYLSPEQRKNGATI